ncbi:MAG: hypothetical protein ACLFQV_10955 [Vulcanimicrobiota bacterium]
MAVKFSYTGSSSSTGGRLSKFTGCKQLFKKAKNSKGIHRALAVVAVDDGPFTDEKYASNLAVDMLAEFFNSDYFQEMKKVDDDEVVKSQISEMLSRINRFVYSYGIQQEYQPKLELAAVFALEKKFYSVSFGGISIIEFNSEKVTELTTPGGWFSGSLKERGLTSEKLKDHLKAGLDKREGVVYLGQAQDIKVPVRNGELQVANYMAVLNDGVSQFIPNEEVKLITISEDTVSEACHRLVSMAKERGVKGNAAISIFTLIRGEDADADQSVEETIGTREKKKKGCSCNAVYSVIVFLLLVGMLAAAYIGFLSARKTADNLEKQRTGADGIQLNTNVPLDASGSHYYVLLDPESARLSFLRLNGRKLDQSQERFDITEEVNRLELQPLMDKGTYTLSIKADSRQFYKVYESNRRNLVQIDKDGVEIFLTKGSVTSIYPDDMEGVAEVKLEGLGSPTRITFHQENLMIYVKTDQPQTEPEPEKKEENHKPAEESEDIGE